MTWRKHLGLRIALWIATVLIGDDLTEDEKHDLKRLRDSLYILNQRVGRMGL